MDESGLEQKAYDFIKSHQKLLIDSFTKDAEAVSSPVSLFMAGSPGAGKTEVSRALMAQFTTLPIRIDADEVRALCPGYTGANAHLFQKAATRGVHILYDYALDHRYHVILDGTFAYANALQNIQRSISRQRKVELWFVYQDPTIAWEFTKAREALEHRCVTRDTFIAAYFKSKTNVKRAKKMFEDQMILNVLIKNADNTPGYYFLDIPSAELDRILPDTYTQDTLERILV